MSSPRPVLAPGRTAVITGAAKGIGEGTARKLADLGMNLCLFDRDHHALQTLCSELQTRTRVVPISGDVTCESDLTHLRDTAFEAFGEVALLMNNAGIIDAAWPWSNLATWRRQLEVNLLSMVTAQSLFVPRMLAQGGPGCIVNLGSKEGITTPPGNAAYSVAKAGVKVLTEQLAHDLREASDSRLSAHLLVPGYTWTPMNQAKKPEAREKPEEAWTCEQLVAYFLARLDAGDFYILCPDNAVTPEMDVRRIEWAMHDMIDNRPALSRWHPEWAERFAEFLRAEG